MALQRDRKVIEITPLVTLFTMAPIATPWARNLSGKISELYTHVMGPDPIEKVAT